MLRATSGLNQPLAWLAARKLQPGPQLVRSGSPLLMANSRQTLLTSDAERYGDELASAARNAGAAGQLDADTRFPR
jgi:hypothetical protein